MSILQKLFGPSKNEIWQQLARELEGEFIHGGYWKKDVVIAKHNQWNIVLDTVVHSSGKHSQTYTRLRAAYINKDGFKFSIYRRSFLSDIAKFFGMQDLEVGYEDFDDDFIIKGNDPYKLEKLFTNTRLRELIDMQPVVELQVVEDRKGLFKKQSSIKTVANLHFEVVGVIKDIHQLKLLYELFAEVLDQLYHINAAYEDAPDV